MNEIAKRIADEMEAQGVSYGELSNLTGIPKSALFRYATGQTGKMPLPRLELIAKALQVEPAYLMGWEEKPELPAKNAKPMPATYKAPRLGRIACGDPILAEENIEAYDDVPAYIKCDFTLLCRGDSMINARIFDGDIVCIKADAEVRSGDIAAVLVDGDEATLKRVRLFADHIILEPENPTYQPKVFWNEDMNRVRIIGKATHFISTVK